MNTEEVWKCFLVMFRIRMSHFPSVWRCFSATDNHCTDVARKLCVGTSRTWTRSRFSAPAKKSASARCLRCHTAMPRTTTHEQKRVSHDHPNPASSDERRCQKHRSLQMRHNSQRRLWAEPSETSERLVVMRIMSVHTAEHQKLHRFVLW